MSPRNPFLPLGPGVRYEWWLFVPDSTSPLPLLAATDNPPLRPTALERRGVRVAIL